MVLADQRLPILATDRVHYVGQPIAVVVADDRYRAEDAAENVEVATNRCRPSPMPWPHSIPPRPCSSTTWTATRRPASTTRSVIPTSAFAGAHRVVEGTYRMNRHGAVPLECRGVRRNSTPGGSASTC